MEIKIKKLREDAKVPTYAHDTDACFDLYAARIGVDDFGNVVYGTGLAFEIPEGYYMQLQPRSSNTKKQLVLLNSPGIVDAGYRGEVTFKYRPLTPANLMAPDTYYNVGERIGQGVILPYPKIEFSVVDELSETDRGVNGYGSTGK